MSATELLNELSARGVTLRPAPDGIRYQAPRGALTPELRERLVASKPAVLEILALERVRETWKPGEWLAYREGDALFASKYAGIGPAGHINLTLADGALRAIPVHRVALEWGPDASEAYEERLCLMLEAGVSEGDARERAEACLTAMSRS